MIDNADQLTGAASTVPGSYPVRLKVGETLYPLASCDEDTIPAPGTGGPGEGTVQGLVLTAFVPTPEG